MSGIELHSPLPPEECERRLAAAVDSRWKMFGSAPVIGSVDAGQLWMRKRIRFRNSFQTVMRGSILADGGGSRLTCRFGMHPLVVAFMIFWFGFVSIVLVIGLLVMLGALPGAAPPDDHQWMMIAIPVAMLALGGATVAFSRWLARDEQAFLTDFVCDTIDARVVESPVLG